MKKPSLFFVFLFLLGLGISEIPEEMRLGDDVSNDFVLSECGTQSFKTGSIMDGATLTSGNESVEPALARTFPHFQFACAARYFYLSGQDRLVLCSIQRT